MRPNLRSRAKSKPMGNRSILHYDVHPLRGSSLLEYPLEQHSFVADEANGEKCKRCGRTRALHLESDTVNPFQPRPKK